MAGKGGARSNAGRKKGGKNAATREREALAQRIIDEQRGKPGKKLAREVLDDYMQLFMGLSAIHQPLPDGVQPMLGQKPDHDKFMLYAQAAMAAAKDLAPYQSPKFKAVVNLGEAMPGGAAAPASPAAVVGAIEAISAQQAYRMLRDSDVIDMVASAAPAQVVPIGKKTRRA